MHSTARRFIATVAATVLTLPVWAQSVPTTLNYQGRLLQNTADQDAVAGTVDIVFSIWSGPASDPAAVQLWSEAWSGVGLSSGIFSVLLGSNGSPLDPADFQGDASLFLQLEIGGETLLPRQQLGSAPFAMVDEPANELQDLELSGDTLGLSGSSATVDLSGYLDNTDEQDLSLAGSTLSLTGDATTVDLSGYLDNTDEQDLSLAGSTLSLTGDPTTVDLSGYLDNTDEQDLSLAGDILSLSGDPTTVDLSGYLDNTDEQDLSLAGSTLSLTGDASTVDLSGFLDNTDEQDLSLAGDILSLTGDGTPVNLSGYRDNTDQQALSLSGSSLSITGGNTVSLSGVNTDSQTLALAGSTLSISGGNSVSLSGFTNTDSQTLGLSGSNLSITGGNTVSLAGFLDNTDSQNLNSVLAQGNDAGNRDITGVRTLTATGLNCPDCIQTSDIDDDTIGGNDIQDNIYILHIDCNGSCANMSMRDACNVIENLRGLSTNAELIGVSCVHGIPSTSGNGFVPCDDGTEVFGSYECRAFNLRTLGDLPCINDDGTDVIVTCLETDIPR